MIHGTPQIFHESNSIFIHVPKCAGTSIEKTLGGREFGGHSYARSIKERYPKEWNEYYKFGFVRDPLTRFASGYRYLKERRYHGALSNDKILLSRDINDYILNYFLKDDVLHLHPQNLFLCDKGKILVDIYKYENLESSWKEILSHLDVKYKPLPLMNKSKDYTVTFEKVSLEILEEYYKDDFILFDY